MTNTELASALRALDHQPAGMGSAGAYGRTDMQYTTYGSVRGQGPVRDSLEAALRDLENDGDGCAAQGGYSDRRVYAIDADGRRRAVDSDGTYVD